MTKHISHEQARERAIVDDYCRETKADCNLELMRMRRERWHLPAIVSALLLACAAVAFFAGCGITPEMIVGAREDVTQARQVVDAAEAKLDELEANPDADPDEVAKAREFFAEARAGLVRADAVLAEIESDEVPEAGAIEAGADLVGAATGHLWIPLIGTTIAAWLRGRRRENKRKADAIALAKSVQPAIDKADETTKTRIRDLQDGQPGIREIVNAATG